MGEAYLDWQKKTSGIKLNDVIEEFKYVYKGQEVKAGDFVNYINGIASKTDYGESVDTQLSTNTNTGTSISAVALDENRVFIAHSYGSNYYLYGIVITINGATITTGTDTELNSYAYAGAQISAVKLQDGRVFIAHSYSSTYYLYGMIVSINGTTVTKEVDTELSSVNYTGYRISARLLPTGQIFIAHCFSSSYYIYGIVISINGTTITSGSDTKLMSISYDINSNIATCLLANRNVFVTCGKASKSYLHGVVVSINDTTIATGDYLQLSVEDYSGRTISLCPLPNGDVFITHSYTSNSKLYGMVVSISGTAITEGTDTLISSESWSGHAISTHLLPNGNVFVAHSWGNSEILYGIIVTIEGTTITVGADVNLTTEEATHHNGYRISSLLLDNGTIFIAHCSETTNYYLYAQIFAIDYENNTPTNHIVITEYEQQVTPAIEPPFNAVALSSGVGGTDTEHNQQVKIARPNVEVT